MSLAQRAMHASVSPSSPILKAGTNNQTSQLLRWDLTPIEEKPRVSKAIFFYVTM